MTVHVVMLLILKTQMMPINFDYYSFEKILFNNVDCYLAVREGCRMMVFMIKGMKSATTLWTFCLYSYRKKMRTVKLIYSV